MRDTLIEPDLPPARDEEFLREAGIAPDLRPRLPLLRKVLLVLALLLAGGTSLLAALFEGGSATGGARLETCATQCPMGDQPAQPGS